MEFKEPVLLKIVGDEWLSCYLMTEKSCERLRLQILQALELEPTLHMEVGQTVAIDRPDHSCAFELFEFKGIDKDFITPIYEYIGGAS